MSLVAVFLCVQPSHADTSEADKQLEADTREADKQLQYVFESVEKARSKLESGSCVVEGKDGRGTFRMDYHFDGQNVRCDRSTEFKGPAGLPVPTKDYFVKTPNIAYLCASQSNPFSIHIHNATKYPNGSDVGYWDLRTTGLSVYHSRDRHSLVEAIKPYQKNLKGRTKVEKANGLWTLTVTHPINETSRYIDTCVIDEKKEFAVLSMFSQCHSGNGEGKTVKLEFDNKTEWAQVGGLWVPTRDVSVHSNPGFSFDYKIDWRAVNKKIDAKLLDYRSFPVPEGTPVVDYTQGYARPVK